MLLSMLMLGTAAAFSGNTGRETTPKPVSLPGGNVMSRTAFVAGVTGALLAPSIAFAKEEAQNNKRSCMDLCLYECVKHGGGKAECTEDCTKQCKTERGQRTMATPITEKGVDYK